MGFSVPLPYQGLPLTNSTWRFQRVILPFFNELLDGLVDALVFFEVFRFFHDFSPSRAHTTDSRQHFTLKSHLLLVNFYFVLSQFHITRAHFSLVFPTYFQFCTKIVVLFLDFSAANYFSLFFIDQTIVQTIQVIIISSIYYSSIIVHWGYLSSLSCWLLTCFFVLIGSAFIDPETCPCMC